MIKITRILCTIIACILVFYDLFIVATTHSITGSISAWFNSFSSYFFIVFGLSFVLGHVFSEKAVVGAVRTRMIRWKLYFTSVTIGITLYDMIVTQFFNFHNSLSYMSHINLPPLLVVIMGLVAGKFLGTMSPTNPQGQDDVH